MIEISFAWNRVQDRHRSAPLLRERERYLAHLHEQGFTRERLSTTANLLLQIVRKRAGVVRVDGAYYQPRMHDLRSTFAHHHITSWVRKKADLNKMLPALAVYMGQAWTRVHRAVFLPHA